MPATMRAPPPFDSKDANLVLVSSDGVEFRVHKHMIALASPVLAALIPASSNSLAPPHPYVHPRQPRQRPRLLLSQPAHVLNIFLRFIYPTPEPPSLSLPTVSLLLSLAHDYSATSITTRMRPHLLSAIHLDHSPLAVYALASSAGMPDVARLAARRALAHPLPPARELTGSAFGLAGDTLLRLLAYRRACAAAAAEVASTRAGVPWWIQLRWRSYCFLSECWACPRGARRTLKWKKVVGESVEVPVWWVEYLNEVQRALLGEKLDPAVAQDRAIMRRAVEGAAGCERCKERVFWDMVEFARILEDAIEEAISSVHLDGGEYDEYHDSVSESNALVASTKTNYLLSSDKPVWPLFDYFYTTYSRRLEYPHDDELLVEDDIENHNLLSTVPPSFVESRL